MPARRLRTLPLLSTLIATMIVINGCITDYRQGTILSIISQPADQTVVAGDSGTFVVSVEGNGPYTYQWFRNGQPISGATSSTYVTPDGTLAMSGSLYTVKVVDFTSAKATSRAANLTVTPRQPVLQFAPIQGQVFGGPPFVASASSASKGVISYSVVSGPATIANAAVTANAPGAVTLLAVQAAEGDYTSARATTTFMVAQNVSISAITPINQTMGPGLMTFAATTTGGFTNQLIWTATGGAFAGNVWTSPTTKGVYTITATSVDDSTKSVSTTVTISPPVITKQPLQVTACPTSSVSFSVSADYARTFEWRLNGVALAGASWSTYTIPYVNSSLDAGVYTAVVSNEAGSVTSIPVIVAGPPSIVSNPIDVSVPVSQMGIFSAAASGVGPFTYQWYVIPPGQSNGVPLPGAPASFFMTTGVTAANDGEKYYAVATDACGVSLTSTTATLTVTGVHTPPTILTPPLATTVQIGDTATMSAVAAGSPPLSYQWFRVPAGSLAGAPISGATSAAYTIPATATTISNDQDAYFVTVSNPYGSASSQRAVLTVGTGIRITKQPVSVFVNRGDSATFTVNAVSSLPLSYQWYSAAAGSSRFTAIPGATDVTYMIASTSASDVGSTYYVAVSNGVSVPLQSDTAAIFDGNATIVDSCSWNLLGDAAPLGNCSYRLTKSEVYQSGEIVWPNLVSTGNMRLSFTVATSDVSSPAADGFAVVLGDPSLGATLTSRGQNGYGLGAEGIPGLVITFDDYLNSGNQGQPNDPQVPYLGVGRGEVPLWESPYFNVNTSIPALAASGLTVSHDYVVLLVNGYITVTMDGNQIFSGRVDAPPVAYLYVTSSTGSRWETAVVSSISAIVSKP